MCGIAGIWNLNNESLKREALVRFTNSLSHRGPDGYGYYMDEKAQLGLGHRRLSILDITETGKQPMSFAEGRYWITYNGEVFNFIELRNEFKQRGYSFVSDSDTEVILAAYHLWGQDCLFKFNGMWALAIWDSQEQTLFLARDRFGIKPLYYYCTKDHFAFASETISFKYLEGFKRQIDKTNLTRALINSFALDGLGYTIFSNIYQLLPGHYLLFRKNAMPQQRRWWSTKDHLISVPDSYEEQVEKFKELFEDSCKLRMRSDVSIASALSGGLDSSSVYCMLHHIMNSGRIQQRVPSEWQKAFVTTFPGSEMDERAYAEEVIKYVNGNATYITQDYKHIIDKIISSTVQFDQIFISPIFVANDIYNAMSKVGIKVSMDGHGVDEMLFGYPHLVAAAYNTALNQIDKKNATDWAITYKNMLPIGKQELAFNALTGNQKKQGLSFSKKLYNQFLPESMKQVYRKLRNTEPIQYYSSELWLKEIQIDDLISLTDQKEDISQMNLADQLIYENFHVTTLPTILRNFDRASMQSSVEVRMPFMDWRLVTYVFSLPMKSKVGKGVSKRIVRDCMKGIIPESIRKRTLKLGLGSPLTTWFSHEMKNFILDEINSSSFLHSDVWNGESLNDFASEKIKNQSWDWEDCVRFWPYINASLILKNL